MSRCACCHYGPRHITNQAPFDKLYLSAQGAPLSVSPKSDLDWKSELPSAKGLPQTDFPKDVAAMASSGGVIVFGVRESQ